MVLTAHEAGVHLASLACKYDFAFFEYWLTDYAGHGQKMDDSLRILEQVDAVLGGVLKVWDDNNLILITSDHGNLEDLSTRRHTLNQVPLLLIGNSKLRRHFEGITDLTGVFPAILRVIDEESAVQIFGGKRVR